MIRIADGGYNGGGGPREIGLDEAEANTWTLSERRASHQYGGRKVHDYLY